MTASLSASILPQGRLGNLAKAAFVPTPPSVAEAIMTNLLRVGDPPRTPVLDPAAGEGDLLHPAFTRGMPCFAVEIERVRADRARARLPGATILTASFEAVSARGRFSLLLVNPPYLAEGGQRQEHFFVKKAGAWLRPGGILVAVIPARSAWSALIQHLVRCYEDIRVWRLPEQVADGPGFSAYTQLIVCGRRRARAVTPASPELFAQAQAEAARLQEIEWTNGRWHRQVPPELPTSPLPDPYEVPPAERMPSLFLEESTDAQVLWQFLPESCLEQNAHWRRATEGQSLQEEAAHVQELTLPYSSSTLAHLAAKILSGALNGRWLSGLPGQAASQGAFFEAFVIQQWTEVPLEEEEAEAFRHMGVQRAYARLRHELPVVGLLSRDSWKYLTGPEALRFLAQAQEQLVQQLLSLPHRIAYPLDPTDRELGILLQLGRDKQLAGMPWPGFADQQIHTILGMYRALGRSRRVLLQAEPGTGKTRMCTGLAALLAADWRQRRPGQRWIKRLRRAWLKQPFLRDLLGVEPAQAVSSTGLKPPQRRPRLVGYRKVGTDQVVRPQDAGPCSLPVLVTTPLRVALEYQREVQACWPEAEVLLVRTVDEARAWLQRCATSQAPAVVGILPQSRSQALDLSWRPAILERKRGHKTVFCCPGCGQVITARPWQALGEAAGEEDEQGDLVKPAARPADLPPVGSRRWFELRPRWHQCPTGKRTALFTYCRRPETERQYKPLAFAEWSRLITHHRPPDDEHGWWLSVVGEQVEWKKAPATISLSPFEWLYRFARGAIGLVIVDESHNARSRSSDLARCMQLALAAGQQGVLASGTHYGGNIEGLFHYWYRLVDAALWKRWGLRWADVGQAQELFGMTRCVVKGYEPPPSSKKRRGDMIVHTSTPSAPGISVRLLPFLLGRMVFLSLEDIGALMPPLREIPVLVRLEDSQVQAAWAQAAQLREQARLLQRAASAHEETQGTDELEEETRDLLEEARELEEWAEARDLHRAYLRLCQQMEDEAPMNATVRMACATLPRWFVCLPCDKPFQLVLTRRSAWGDEEGQEVALSTPVLEWDHLYPLERKLQELISQELAEERRVLVYVEQSRERSMARRLSFVLREWQHWLWTLPDQVKPEERQQAIWEAVAQGKRIIIAQYRAVSEGLNLQFLDSIVWYELPLNLFLLDQASRRCWRLGRQGEVRVYYLAYAGTPAYAKLMKLGQQHGAASAFAGQLAEGGLSETTAADQTALAQLTLHLASAHEEAPGREQGSEPLLMELDTADLEQVQEQLTEAFARRRAAFQRGRQWLGGYQDRLRERLAQWHRLGDEVQGAQDPTGTEGHSPWSAPQEEGPSAISEVLALPQPEPCPAPPDTRSETRRRAEEHAPPLQTQESPSSAAEQDQARAVASVSVEPEARPRLVFGDSALLSALAAAQRRRHRHRTSTAAGAQSSLWD